MIILRDLKGNIYTNIALIRNKKLEGVRYDSTDGKFKQGTNDYYVETKTGELGIKEPDTFFQISNVMTARKGRGLIKWIFEQMKAQRGAANIVIDMQECPLLEGEAHEQN